MSHLAQISLSVVIWVGHIEHRTARSDAPCREKPRSGLRYSTGPFTSRGSKFVPDAAIAHLGKEWKTLRLSICLAGRATTIDGTQFTNVNGTVLLEPLYMEQVGSVRGVVPTFLHDMSLSCPLLWPRPCSTTRATPSRSLHTSRFLRISLLNSTRHG